MQNIYFTRHTKHDFIIISPNLYYIIIVKYVAILKDILHNISPFFKNKFSTFYLVFMCFILLTNTIHICAFIWNEICWIPVLSLHFYFFVCIYIYVSILIAFNIIFEAVVGSVKKFFCLFFSRFTCF